MTALLDTSRPGVNLPHLAEWLKLAAPIREILENDYTDLTTPEQRATAAAQENVLFALDNLRSYPCVQARLADGSLSLHGWFFKIATAELFAYDPEVRQFQPIIQS
jgi:carbonic anhydrase